VKMTDVCMIVSPHNSFGCFLSTAADAPTFSQGLLQRCVTMMASEGKLGINRAKRAFEIRD